MKMMKLNLSNKRKSQSGQGMTEYILLIVVVIGIATVFKEPIKRAVSGKMQSVEGSIQGFTE